MAQVKRIFLVILVLATTLSVIPAQAVNAGGGCDPDGEQPSGALYRICMPRPEIWNGSLIIYAHGYVPFYKPIAIPDDDLTLPDGTSLPEVITQLGFAFAVTSYRVNGLAVREAVEDIRELVEIFVEKYGQPEKIYILGGSEGGLVTTLAVERYPQHFDGGLAVCGPIGDFRKQIDYMAEFRVIFDYFYPGVIPGSPTGIPREVMEGWQDIYKQAVLDAIDSSQSKTNQLFRVTSAATDNGSQESKRETAVSVLWYNVFATNDAKEKLGGQPFDNQWRIYTGSKNDFQLNLKVRRFKGSSTAIREINAHYQTSGKLTSELVTMHTSGDPIVPSWHASYYLSKVASKGALSHYVHIPIYRYGHCNFKVHEVLAGLAVLYWKVNDAALPGIESVLISTQDLSAYQQMLEELGVGE